MFSPRAAPAPPGADSNEGNPQIVPRRMFPTIPRAGQVPASPREGTPSPDSSRSMPRAGLGRTLAASGKSACAPESDRADAAPPEIKTKTRGSHPLPGSGCPVVIPSLREVAVLVPAARPNPTMIYAGHRHFRLKPRKSSAPEGAVGSSICRFFAYRPLRAQQGRAVPFPAHAGVRPAFQAVAAIREIIAGVTGIPPAHPPPSRRRPARARTRRARAL